MCSIQWKKGDGGVNGESERGWMGVALFYMPYFLRIQCSLFACWCFSWHGNICIFFQAIACYELIKHQTDAFSAMYVWVCDYAPIEYTNINNNNKNNDVDGHAVDQDEGGNNNKTTKITK